MPARTHGLSHTKEHNAWLAMKARCYRKSDPHYPRWGGRGIRVCDRWRSSFENFLEDVGFAPTPKHTVERVQNNGDYEPGNVRWAVTAEQNRNQRRNRRLTYLGRTMTMSEWARECLISEDALRERLLLGWPVSEALTTPSSKFNKRRTVTITAWGKTQRLARWAEELGLSLSTLSRRVRYGDTGDHALRPLTPPGRYSDKRATKLTHEGITLSISEWACRVGLKEMTLRRRLRSQWDTASALTTPPDSQNNHHAVHVTARGKTQQVSEETGLSHALILSRVNRGLTGEAALAPPRQPALRS